MKDISLSCGNLSIRVTTYPSRWNHLFLSIQIMIILSCIRQSLTSMSHVMILVTFANFFITKASKIDRYWGRIICFGLVILLYALHRPKILPRRILSVTGQWIALIWETFVIIGPVSFSAFICLQHINHHLSNRRSNRFHPHFHPTLFEGHFVINFFLRYYCCYFSPKYQLFWTFWECNLTTLSKISNNVLWK